MRIDDNSPVHYDIDVRSADPHGSKWVLTFRIFAMDRRGRLMIFEYRWPHSFLQTVQRTSVIKELTEKFADPLNAVPGRMEVR